VGSYTWAVNSFVSGNVMETDWWWIYRPQNKGYILDLKVFIY